MPLGGRIASVPLPTPTLETKKTDKGFEFVLIPGHKEECRKAWETQVLLLASLNSKNICSVGLFHLKLDYEANSSWFPTYDKEYPIIHKDIIRSDFLKEKSEIFRASPPKDRKTYFSWLKHVYSKKSQH